MSLQIFCERAKEELYTSADYATTFVNLRIKLNKLFFNGKIISTLHGIDIFDNILDALSGSKWEEKGELGDNFREIIRNN